MVETKLISSGMSHFFPFLLFSLAVSSAASLATTTVLPDGAQNELTSCLSCRLKVETFAVCLQGGRASLTAQDLTSGDLAPSHFDQVKLESFLMTAAGSRNSVLDMSIVDPALERWSRTYYGQEKEFVTTLLNHVNMGTNTISPAMLFEQALSACNSVNPAVLQDPLCAAIVVHNVLNAFGFPDDFRDPTNTDSSTDYFPPWYQQKTPADLTLKRMQLEAALFPLNSSSGALKWSEWVDIFAVLAYGIETATQLMVNNAQDNFSIPAAQYSAAMEKLVRFATLDSVFSPFL